MLRIALGSLVLWLVVGCESAPDPSEAPVVADQAEEAKAEGEPAQDAAKEQEKPAEPPATGTVVAVEGESRTKREQIILLKEKQVQFLVQVGRMV